MSTLAELRQVEKLNSSLQAEIAERTQLVLSSAKVEILGTTLTEWRTFGAELSLQQEPDALELPELAVAPSELAQLKQRLENYPAQKAIEYAMEVYYQASDQVIDMKSTLKTGIPVFRMDQPRVSEQSTAPPGTPSKGTRPPTSKPIRKPVIEAFWTPDYSTAQRPDCPLLVVGQRWRRCE